MAFSLGVALVIATGCGSAPSVPRSATPTADATAVDQVALVAPAGAPAPPPPEPEPSPEPEPEPEPEPAPSSPCGPAPDAPAAEPGEQVLAWLSRDRIRLRKRIRFKLDQAEIRDESLPVIDAVADVLLSNPTLCVEVQGHTDAVGSRARALVLSQERAEAIMRYLVQKGIDTSRIAARGYGPDMPISHPPEGRRGNRRIDFVIVRSWPSSPDPRRP